MKLRIDVTLGDNFATPEEFAEMTNEEVLELVAEDWLEALVGAKWTVVRDVEDGL